MPAIIMLLAQNGKQFQKSSNLYSYYDEVVYHDGTNQDVHPRFLTSQQYFRNSKSITKPQTSMKESTFHCATLWGIWFLNNFSGSSCSVFASNYSFMNQIDHFCTRSGGNIGNNYPARALDI